MRMLIYRCLGRLRAAGQYCFAWLKILAGISLLPTAVISDLTIDLAIWAYEPLRGLLDAHRVWLAVSLLLAVCLYAGLLLACPLVTGLCV